MRAAKEPKNEHSLSIALRARLMGRFVVVGIGARECGDDGVGMALIDRLSRSGLVQTVAAGNSPEFCIGSIIDCNPNTVVFADATDMGARPGSVAIVERDRLMRSRGNGHQPPLSAILSYIAQASVADVFLLGIQPGHIGRGLRLSLSAARTVLMLSLIIEEIAKKEQAAHGRRQDMRKGPYIKLNQNFGERR